MKYRGEQSFAVPVHCIRLCSICMHVEGGASLRGSTYILENTAVD